MCYHGYRKVEFTPENHSFNERSHLSVILEGKCTMLDTKSAVENGMTAVEDDNSPVLEQMYLVTRVVIHEHQCVGISGWENQKNLNMIQHLNH